MDNYPPIYKVIIQLEILEFWKKKLSEKKIIIVKLTKKLNIISSLSWLTFVHKKNIPYV